MRRTFTYILMVCAVVLLSGCRTDDAQSRDVEPLKKKIWNEAKADMSHISELFTELYYFDLVLSVDDATQRDSLLLRHFPNSTMESNGDSYVVTTKTIYGTTYTTTYATDGKSLTQGGRWSVKRTGGNGFDLEIAPMADGASLYAKFKSINIHESLGGAEFEVGFAGISTSKEPIILFYDGYAKMVDRLNSASHPLTLTTNISEPWSYMGEAYNVVQGAAIIECSDALYGVTDVIHVRIDNSYVSIEYMQ